MRRLHGQQSDLRMLRARARIVPVVSTLAGSAVALLPLVATSAWVPPVGLLVLLSWRLLRPELWPVWIGLPLGLADDLVSGQPLGSAASLWTISLILLDITDIQLIWRDYWQEWAIASTFIALCICGGWAFAAFTGGGGSIAAIVPQLLAAIFLFPLVQRTCALLDRWRLEL